MSRTNFTKISAFNNALFEIFFGLGSKLISFSIIIYFARILGANQSTDIIYFTLISISSIISLISAFYTNILLPRLIKYQINDLSNSVNALLNLFFLLTLFFSISITFIIFINSINLVSIFSNFKIKDIEANLYSINLLVLTIPFAILIEFFSIIYKSHQNFFIPGAITFSANLIALFIISSPIFDVAPSLIAYSFFGISIVQFFLHIVFAFKYSILTFFKAKIFKQNLEVAELFKLTPPLLISQVISSILIFYINFISSSFQSGGLTALSLAKRIFDILPTIFIIPIMNASTLHIANLILPNTNNVGKLELPHFNKILYFVTIPILIILPLEIDGLMKVIFNGSKYNDSDIQLTSNLLIVYTLGLTAYCSNSVITKALVLHNKVNTAYINLLFSLCPLIFLPLCTQISVSFWGIYGIAIGNTVYMLLLHKPLGYIIQKKYFTFNLYDEIISLISIITATIILYIPLRLLLLNITTSFTTRVFVNIFLFIIIYSLMIYKVSKQSKLILTTIRNS